MARRPTVHDCSARTGKLTSQERGRLPAHAFGLPELRKFPMYRSVGGHALPDASHARNAKSRAAALFREGGLSRAQLERVDAKADRILAQCGAGTRSAHHPRPGRHPRQLEHYSYPNRDEDDATDIGEPPAAAFEQARIRLRYMPPNLAWIFLFGDTPLQLDGEDMTYQDRRQAVAAAKRHQLEVSRSGIVSSKKLLCPECETEVFRSHNGDPELCDHCAGNPSSEPYWRP